MKTILFRDCKTELDKAKTKEFLKANKKTLDFCVKICYNISRDKKNRTALADFDSPSWPYKRAYLDGYEAALEDLISILTLDQRETH